MIVGYHFKKLTIQQFQAAVGDTLTAPCYYCSHDTLSMHLPGPGLKVVLLLPACAAQKNHTNHLWLLNTLRSNMDSCQTALLIGNDDSSLRGFGRIRRWDSSRPAQRCLAARRPTGSRAHGKTFRERADGWTLGIKHFQFGYLEAAQREHQSLARCR